jgi:arrestin-related trafficking adapter 3/6
MRLSRPDENDPNKRRHFEISIDSPFNILSCRATQANTSLPAYSWGGTGISAAEEYECGCPGAALRRRNTPPGHPLPPLNNLTQNNSSTASVDTDTAPHSPTRSWTSNSGGITLPTQAHVHDPSSGPTRLHDPNQGAPRPMHLLRAPSFNPPPFDEDEAPPPLVTPPPNYENIVSGNSQNALADYFARLADELGDEEDQGDRGRVDLPLTPGGRVNRSMDARRDWLPLGGAAATVVSAPDVPTS